MEFLEVMSGLFDIKREFPGMHWHTNDNGEIIINIYVGEENVSMLHGAAKLMAPK